MDTTSHKSPPPADQGAEKSSEKSRYKGTLNLPKTAFPMKANLLQNEPASLQRWGKMRLYERLRQKRRTDDPKKKFVFHDGPPYANGSLHLGHLMNRCLKDFVVRTRSMQGLDCPFIPGWDCHGLPIEHKVVTEMLESGKAEKLKTLTEDQRRVIVRRECQAHAEKFHKLHTQQMTRLLTLADYEHPYLTMQPSFEGNTLEVLALMLEQGLVYRALKPVHWSIANETALAEAELEYMDREDLSVYVEFPARDATSVAKAFGLPAGNEPTAFLIWTTTPWTLPANLAIAVNPDFEYALVEIDEKNAKRRLIIARELVEKVIKSGQAKRTFTFKVLGTAGGSALLGLRYTHPFVQRSDDVFRVVGAEYVTLEDGTGLVHTAPGHGVEDYQTGLREKLPIYCPVRADGTYDDSVPTHLRGLSIWKANSQIAEELRAAGRLFHDHVFTHSYPHDWRSKTPVIFRCTEQWFVGVERPTAHGGKTLRELALHAAQSEVAFVPEWGRNRLRGMLESRPDWCISRQRAWGLPIPAFELTDGSVFMTPACVRAVASLVRQKGSDVWFTGSPAELLSGYDAAKDPHPAAEKVRKNPALLAGAKKTHDILDVWFESGSSWNTVLKDRGMGYPADLYLEGSDQHRGWFQLSLLAGLAATGQAPFRALVTHGFMVDKDGRKLSKSLGDTIEDLFRDYGVDVLRWWVSSLTYENDVKVDRAFYDLAGESYRKVRNTLRFMLSNLDDFTPGAASPPAVTSLEAWVLGEFDALCKETVEAYARYDYRTAHLKIYDFCNSTLSAIYLAAVKDRLYCDKPDSARRRQTQSALWTITDGLCRLLAPVLCHTADEAFRALRKAPAADAELCVHLETFPASTGVKPDQAWGEVMRARERAMQAMEDSKATLGVENPLDMGVALPDPSGTLGGFDPVDLADLLGVSRVTLDRAAKDPRVLDLRAEPRCERSWKRDGTVRARGDGGLLSDRDAAALGLA